MKHAPLPRLDEREDVRRALLPLCRLKPGEVWEDPVHGHRIGCLDAGDATAVEGKLLQGERARLALHDPPYNLVAFGEQPVEKFIAWCRGWIATTERILLEDGALYIWLGADQNQGFQPLPDFMIMMREMPFRSRSLITMRNQRGYGTSLNWMAVRQELLYYVKGQPDFDVQAEYTDIPKILRGYYKNIAGEKTENLKRGKSPNIRAGNVWVDCQQVFYRMEENVSGCYAQKPLKAIERIVAASSKPDEIVVDFFAHAGTTLLAAERLGRRCLTIDVEPIFCEITRRRLEHFRATGRLGWQHGNAFESDFGEIPGMGQ